jgi:hypothetical protein
MKKKTLITVATALFGYFAAYIVFNFQVGTATGPINWWSYAMPLLLSLLSSYAIARQWADSFAHKYRTAAIIGLTLGICWAASLVLLIINMESTMTF